jgi:hypothetical protein
MNTEWVRVAVKLLFCIRKVPGLNIGKINGLTGFIIFLTLSSTIQDRILKESMTVSFQVLTYSEFTIIFDAELRLSPRLVGGNIGSTDATKTCHILNAYIFETKNRKVMNNTSADSL